MSEALKILERAISDVGHWRWWVRSDTVSHVEFGWVMLLIPSENASRPPSSTIALRFHDPRCIVALQRATEGSGLPDDWFAKLAEDKIEPPGVSDGDFTLTDLGQLRIIYQEAHHRDFILGDERDLENIGQDEVFMAFWAGNVGLVVRAKSLEVLSHQGPIESEDIPARSSAWWNYWREYWKRLDGDDSMPKDPLCEITIPAGD